MAVCEPEKQTVGPGFVDKTKLPCYSLVVVRVMEATHMLHLITVNGSGAEIFYRRVYPVIVIGIVLEKIELIFEATAKSLAEVDVWFVCIERTIAIARIHKPAALSARSDYIDYSTDCIRSKAHRHNSAIHFNTLCKIDRYIIQTKRTPGSLLRHTIDKYLYVLSAEAVHRDGHIAPHSSALAYFHAGSFRQSLAKSLGGIHQLLSIYCRGIKGRVSDFTQLIAHHYHLAKLCGWFQFYSLTQTLSRLQCHGEFLLFITRGGNHKSIHALWRCYMVQTLLIGIWCICGILEIYCSKVYCFTVDWENLSRHHRIFRRISRLSSDSRTQQYDGEQYSVLHCCRRFCLYYCLSIQSSSFLNHPAIPKCRYTPHIALYYNHLHFNIRKNKIGEYNKVKGKPSDSPSLLISAHACIFTLDWPDGPLLRFGMIHFTIHRNPYRRHTDSLFPGRNKRYDNRRSQSPDLDIPPMLLVTFVENCFKYGISPIERSNISISLSAITDRQSL